MKRKREQGIISCHAAAFTSRQLGAEERVDFSIITLRNLGQTWAISGLEKIKERYPRTNSVSSALETLAEGIDAANLAVRNEELPPSRCLCTENESKEVIHLA